MGNLHEIFENAEICAQNEHAMLFSSGEHSLVLFQGEGRTPTTLFAFDESPVKIMESLRTFLLEDLVTRLISMTIFLINGPIIKNAESGLEDLEFHGEFQLCGAVGKVFVSA